MPETLTLPLTVRAGAGLAALTADTPAEIGQAVAVLLSTRVGERRSEPAYGSRGQLFSPVPALAVDTAAITAWEPRASAELVEVTITGRSS